MFTQTTVVTQTSSCNGIWVTRTSDGTEATSILEYDLHSFGRGGATDEAYAATRTSRAFGNVSISC